MEQASNIDGKNQLSILKDWLVALVLSPNTNLLNPFENEITSAPSALSDNTSDQ